MPVCRLCEREVPKLAKSHLLGNGAHRRLATPEGVSAHLDPAAPRPELAVSRRFTGPYDWFACGDCERVHFQLGDDYVFRLLDAVQQDRTRWRVHEAGGGTLKHRQHAGRPDLLHRYALQCLFREHLSRSRFELGVVAADFEELVVDSEPTIESSFGVMVTYIREESSRYCTGGVPMDERGSHPIFVFTIPHLLFTVAASRAGLPLAYRPFQLEPGPWVNLTHWKRAPDFVRAFNEKIVTGHLDRMRDVLSLDAKKS